MQRHRVLWAALGLALALGCRRGERGKADLVALDEPPPTEAEGTPEVRAAMDAQVVNEGRHQGGRAPYGYVVVDGARHPNPRKAAEGYRLRMLALDEPGAEVVRRIFAEYLDGKGDRAIANGLNRDGILCPRGRFSIYSDPSHVRR